MSRSPLPALIYYLALILVVAGLTHLISLLIVPVVAGRDAYTRVAALAEPFKTAMLPPATPQMRAFPFADPAAASSVCRYDLANGPVRARAPLAQPGFASLTFHSRRGVIYYALTDRAAVKGRMDALIVTAEQLRVLLSHDDEDNPSEDLRIVSPTAQGFVMMRALSGSPDEMSAAEDEVAAMTCVTEPVAEAEK